MIGAWFFVVALVVAVIGLLAALFVTGPRRPDDEDRPPPLRKW